MEGVRSRKRGIGGAGDASHEADRDRGSEVGGTADEVGLAFRARDHEGGRGREGGRGQRAPGGTRGARARAEPHRGAAGGAGGRGQGRRATADRGRRRGREGVAKVASGWWRCGKCAVANRVCCCGMPFMLALGMVLSVLWFA